MQAIKEVMNSEITTHTQTLGSLSKRCEKCGQTLYMQIELFGQKRTVRKQCECERKEYEKRKKEEENKQRQYKLDRLRQYSMMDEHFKKCTFKNFRVDESNKKVYEMALNYCKRWPEMKEKNMGFLFYGPPGTGKTYLAFCIANKLLENLVPVIAISSIGLLNRIKQSYSNFGEKGEVEVLSALKNASMIILDDLGAESDTAWAKEKLYEIIDSRYRDGKPMICTTNLTREQLRDKLTGKDGITRTYDRLIEICYPIKISGPSKRVQSASEKAEIIKNLLR